MFADLPVLPQTHAFLNRKLQMLIGAEWCDAISGATLDFRNPASGEVIGQVPSASADDVDRA